MSLRLLYGNNSKITLDLEPEVLVADCSTPRGTSLEDPAAAVAAALLDPLDYPPLLQAMVPGDQIVIALGDDVPQPSAVVAGVVHTLLDGGCRSGDITILQTQNNARFSHRDPAVLLPEEVRQAISVVVHDPSDQEKLSYLAASKEAKPVYLNRMICDADFVIPIGCLQVEESLGCLGIHGGLFPAFADKSAQERFRAPSSAASSVSRRRRREEAREAAWLLGIGLGIQIVPGARGSVLHVLAGELKSIMAQGTELCERAWSHTIPTRADLVIVSIEGPEDQQTWNNFARALHAASCAVVEGGSIVICTEISCSPGAALQRLAGAESRERAIFDLRRERTDDASAAFQLAQALDSAKVFFLSHLAEEVVEELGMAYVENAEEIVRLSHRNDSCLLLANAQYAMATTADEVVESG